MAGMEGPLNRGWFSDATEAHRQEMIEGEDAGGNRVEHDRGSDRTRDR
jgi:hypothetical protein